MTIEYQIRKLQYDINREALLSGKIDKYEYLTGEEISPSNKQHIIKQTKTIEDQGEKQSKAIQDNKKRPACINEDYNNKLFLSKEREIFRNIFNKRPDKKEELNKKIDYDNLKYVVKTTGKEFEFDKSENPLEFFNDIKTG